jgi:predicted acylesterase/phospholipase RssA/CRP-like cAMP-binding protein
MTTAMPPSKEPQAFVPADEINFLELFTQAGLAEQLERVHLHQGEVLYEQGDPGDDLYVLIRGRLGVRLQREDGRELEIGEEDRPGATVGEMSLVTGQARAVTVYALSDVELAKLPKSSFDRFVKEHPRTIANLAKMTALRWQRIQLARVLTDLLGELDRSALLDLQAELVWQQLSHDEVLFHQGDPGDAAYIVVNGRLCISVVLPDGSEHDVDESGPGDIVGEFALLTGESRSATVRAIRETNVVKMTPPVFSHLLERYPQAMMQIARIIIKRHKRSLRYTPAERIGAINLALLPASPSIVLTENAHQLAVCLSEFGRVLHLNSTRLDQIYGQQGAAQIPLDTPTSAILDSWMSAQETQYRYILYEADPEFSTWTRRCVRQADRIVLLAQSNENPVPGPLEAAIQTMDSKGRVELVLLHPANVTRPTETSRWLSQRKVHAHYHVSMNDDAHYHRLARLLIGQANGLVLSGGGARGFAHLGVLRALEELNIPIDRIGGTSMGSLIGAGVAMGRENEEMWQLAHSFSSPRRIFDYTLPFVSLMASKKVTRLMMELFGELHIEDLWQPYFCISANLTQAEPVVHQRGPLWKSVRASIAIPGVFTPILHEGDVLVDGGAMNNFPLDIMYDLCEGGTVIGSNVSPQREMAAAYKFGANLSGWQVLWNRINPFAERMVIPALTANLTRTLELNSVYKVKSEETLADLLIQPDVSKYSSMDYAAYEAIIEAGYREAKRQLEAVGELPNGR